MKVTAFNDFSLASLVTMDLTARSIVREYLDDFLAPDPHIAATLRNLEHVNFWLSGIRRLCDATIFSTPQTIKKKRLTIVDLGCGGGDLALWLSSRCSQKGMEPRIIGIDHDPRIAAIALERCRRDRAITIINQSADSLDRLAGGIDWIVSNHFLHHLAEDEINHLLRVAACRAEHGVVMNDLVRSRVALVGFGLLCSAARPAGHTAHDGVVSITRSFTKKELTKILHDAGLARAAVKRSGIGHQSIVLRRG
jgi:2-polyprenyl-3-methyl-5-hydroxy-6-metoxy-1,4-benzoquinol methylase